ncbi:MAG TPA: hypothetical protein ENK87_03230 [Nitratifractor sp.]|nr:hypothetical protein [Nitratifractor sp.]HHH20918.1 hypothetical protein [Nitratifractor sp.]
MCHLIMRVSKSYLKILLLNLLLLSSLEAFFTDISLPKVTGVKSVVDRNSIGFEWKSLFGYQNIQGVSVYRAKAVRGAKQTYTKIATISNRFATHFVDTNIEPNANYFYTFTTYSGLSESLYGDIVPVKSAPPYARVQLVEAKVVGDHTVKLLWIPNSEPTIYEYVIERKGSDGKWHYLKSLKGRLYPEFVDTTVNRGKSYSYRVYARDAMGMTSYIGNELKVEVR